MKPDRNMKPDRMYFKDNPWPEGHPIKTFNWTARVVDGEVWFDFHLETANYYAERDIEEDDDFEYESDWKAPAVWGNFHSCTLSSTDWHEGGIRVCKVKDYSPEFLDGLELAVDMHPENMKDWDEAAFHIYLLGHDAVARHKIQFIRKDKSRKFTIVWSGQIALAYAGDYEYRHSFALTMKNQKFPKIK